jgi:hypothetical protein
LANLLPSSRRQEIQENIRASMSAFPRFDARQRAVPYRDILEAIRQFEG